MLEGQGNHASMVGEEETEKHSSKVKMIKWWVLAQPPYSPKEMGGSHQGENHGDRSTDWEDNLGSSEDETVGTYQIHSCKTRITRVQAP